MGQKYVKYRREFRESALRRLSVAPNVAQLCRELGHLAPAFVFVASRPAAGRREAATGCRTAASPGEPSVEESAGEEDAGSGFFEGCLRKGRGSAPERYRFWRQGIWEVIREMMPTQCSLGIEPMCRLAKVSRAGFYRFLRPRYPGEEQMEVRNAIQQIVLEHRRRYGYRRVDSRTAVAAAWPSTISACCG